MPSDNKIPERIRQAKNLRFERIKKLHPETFCDEVAVFAENSNLNNPKTKLYIRYNAAKENLDSIIGQYYTKEKILDVLSALYEKEDSVNLNQTAENLNKILENPEEYSLTQDEANQIAENFLYMVTKDEKHNPLHNSFDQTALNTQALFKDLKDAESSLSQKRVIPSRVEEVNKIRLQYSQSALNQFNTVMLLATPEQKAQIKAKFESDYPELFNESLNTQAKVNAIVNKSKLPPPSPLPSSQPPAAVISRATLDSDAILKDLKAAEEELSQMSQAQRMSDSAVKKEVEKLRNRYNAALEKEKQTIKPEELRELKFEPHRYDPKSQAETFFTTFNSKLDETTKEVLPEGYEIINQKTYQQNIKNELYEMTNNQEKSDVPYAYAQLALGVNTLAASNNNNLSDNRNSLSSLFNRTQATFYQPQNGGGGGGGSISNFTNTKTRKMPDKIKNNTLKKLASSKAGKFIGNVTGNVYVKAALGAKNLINGKFNKNIFILGAGFVLGGPLGLVSIGLVLNARFRAFLFKNTLQRFIKTLLLIQLLLFILVPLVLVIINNSAYMVPPTDKGKPMQADAGIPGFLGAGESCAWPSCWPVDTGTITQIPNPAHGTLGSSGNAIDIGLSVGNAVYATHDGIAEYMYYPEESGYGYNIRIDGAGISTIYAHLSTSNLPSGIPTSVLAGQIIGASGGQVGAPGAGTTSGPHLHYEVTPASIPINTVVPRYTCISSNPMNCGSPLSGCFASDMVCYGTSGFNYEGNCESLVQSARSIANALTLVPNPVRDINGILYTHGVWDYWNYNPMFPEFWSNKFYQDHVNPEIWPDAQSADPGATDIFWCTALVMKAYEFSNLPFYTWSQVAMVGNMMTRFTEAGRFGGSNTPADQIPAGSAIFFSNQHVAMILSIEGQIVTIAESNSLPLGHAYDDITKGPGRDPVNTSRVIVENNRIIAVQGNHSVSGFGFPPAECYTE